MVSKLLIIYLIQTIFPFMARDFVRFLKKTVYILSINKTIE
ncbi:hypothetical protein LEP1GSC199_1518 [Leptospira vanthielii serovar Holland str. Waz Holland = ATCC 700522]|uniref:Uncharacterized protein n=1 Tax=Leptospira vanthielii serovar Holland str. Waz Holland = ATCC 700522 TaxID=1218591 RepID=N1W5P1_9LEPT|nr:hypothetical protein LEP1GSC199_1518 [Leptospira vanthielii serovar Holland str. Waz Holland = ATCC 700522]